MATTSTEILCALNASNTRARKPDCPTMRVLTTSTSVTLPLRTHDVTSEPAMSRDEEMTVPGAVLREKTKQAKPG